MATAVELKEVADFIQPATAWLERHATNGTPSTSGEVVSVDFYADELTAMLTGLRQAAALLNQATTPPPRGQPELRVVE